MKKLILLVLALALVAVPAPTSSEVVCIGPSCAMPLQVLRGELTSAQLKALFTTPITVFPDTAGVTYIPRYLWIRKPAGSAGYTLNGSATLRLNYGATAGALSAMQVSAAGTFDQATEQTAIWFGVSGGTFNVGLGGVNSPAGLGLRWMLPTADWTVGDSPVIWDLYYYRMIQR